MTKYLSSRISEYHSLMESGDYGLAMDLRSKVPKLDFYIKNNINPNLEARTSDEMETVKLLGHKYLYPPHSSLPQ